MASLVSKALRDVRWAALGWGGGMFVLVLIHMAVFPSVASDESLGQFYENLPQGLRDALGGSGRPFNTIEGYLEVELGSYGPILLAVFAMTQAVKALAGEEQDGHLDFLLGQPFDRRAVVVVQALTHAGAVLAVAVVAGIGLFAGGLVFGVEVDAWRLMLAMLNTVPIAVAVGGITLVASAAAHRRATPILVGTLVLVTSFFLNALAPLADATRDLRWGSLFYLYQQSDAFGGKVDPLYATVCLLIWVVGIVTAAVLFQRKDIRA